MDSIQWFPKSTNIRISASSTFEGGLDSASFAREGKFWRSSVGENTASSSLKEVMQHDEGPGRESNDFHPTLSIAVADEAHFNSLHHHAADRAHRPMAHCLA